jgi:hypothetical protein
MNITVKRFHSKKTDADIPKTPEQRLELVELLRIQAGKFLYDYPARFRRVVKVVRAK